MADLREKPYFHVTWLSPLLYGLKQCNWATWYRAHYYFKKTPSTLDLAAHNLKHTAVRGPLIRELEAGDCDLILEEELKLEGKRATISGRIDALVIRDDMGIVFEVKSGAERPSDKVQLMIYMWMLAWVKGGMYKDITFDGLLVYPEKRVEVKADEINDDFKKIMEDFITDMLNREPPRKYPSFGECKYCNVAECDERIGILETSDQSSTYLPDFL